MESKTIYIPETYADITLDQLQRIRRLEGDEEFVTIKTIEILCGVRGDEILRMKVSDRVMIISAITEALSHEPSKLVKRLTHNGVEYGFHPSLEDMSYGEFVDLKTYESDFDKIHLLMSILYRPIKEKHGNTYTIEPYKGTSDALKDMPSDIALGAMVFFYALAKECAQSSLNYLMGGVEVRNKTNSPTNGDGIQQRQVSLMMTLRALEKSLIFQPHNALQNWRTKLINMN